MSRQCLFGMVNVMSDIAWNLRKRGLGHGEESVLNGKALMIGESGKERGTYRGA